MFLALMSGAMLAVLSAQSPTVVATTTAEAQSESPLSSKLAGTITEITGIAISPMMGVSAIGAYRYFKSDETERASLPWYCHPVVWMSGLLLVGACAFKDSFGTVIPPGLKKPFDVLEAVENKASGLVATAAVVPLTVSSLSGYLDQAMHSTGLAAQSTGWLPLAAIDWTPVFTILMLPLGMAAFLIVWLLSHTINVIILISPFSILDAGLKGFKSSLLGLLVIVASIDPVVGALLSLAIVAVACLMAGWAFRLLIFGAIFTWDFCSRRKHRFVPCEDNLWLFTAHRIEGVPVRTYGRLQRRAEGTGPIDFHFRPWLFRKPRQIEMPAGHYAVGKGLLYSVVRYAPTEGGKARDQLTLPPRYRGHEEKLAALANWDCSTVGLRRGLKLAWEWLKDNCGWGSPQKTLSQTV